MLEGGEVIADTLVSGTPWTGVGADQVLAWTQPLEEPWVMAEYLHHNSTAPT